MFMFTRDASQPLDPLQARLRAAPSSERGARRGTGAEEAGLAAALKLVAGVRSRCRRRW